MENRISTKQIGDGKLPNKYWVSVANDYYISNKDGDLEWASETVGFKSFGKTVAVFSTYTEAMDRAIYIIANNLTEPLDGIAPSKDDIHSVFIEDRFSGQIYEYVLTKEIRIVYEPMEIKDTKFSKEAMEKLGVEFK